MGLKLYQEQAKRNRLILAGLLSLTLFFAMYFSVWGMGIPMWKVGTALLHWYENTWQTGTEAGIDKVLLLLRLPRICLALVAGAGLAGAGAIMQSITRNYLVSPFTLGISSAAAFGAALYIVLLSAAETTSEYGMIFCAFCASVLCGILVYMIAQRLGLRPTSLVLIGIALNYFFSASTSVLEFFAQEHKLENVVQWTFGTLNRASWSSVGVTVGVVVIGVLLLLWYRLQFNAIAANDDESVRSLGVNPLRLRSIGGMISIFITATIISFTGVIGFIGLIAPHMARLLVGNDHRFYLPAACILGAFLLLVADTAGRFILSPVTIPVGIVISFLGVPLFIYLILLKGKNLR